MSLNPQSEPWNAAPSATDRTAILNDKIAAARDAVPLDHRWRHKKGGIYLVLDHVINTDTGNVMILYGRVDGPDYDEAAEEGIFFVRPIEEWTLDRFTPLP